MSVHHQYAIDELDALYNDTVERLRYELARETVARCRTIESRFRQYETLYPHMRTELQRLRRTQHTMLQMEMNLLGRLTGDDLDDYVEVRNESMWKLVTVLADAIDRGEATREKRIAYAGTRAREETEWLESRFNALLVRLAEINEWRREYAAEENHPLRMKLVERLRNLHLPA